MSGIFGILGNVRTRAEQCLILYDEHKVGTKRQCEGVCRWLQCVPDIAVTRPMMGLWKWLPRRLWPPVSMRFMWDDGAHESDKRQSLTLRDFPPCTLIIAGGRQSTYAGACLKKIQGNRPRLIGLMNPALPHAWFDAIVAPCHDNLKGSRVLSTPFAPHILSANFLQHEARTWGPHFAHYASPLTAVLIGGPCRSLSMPPAWQSQFIHDLTNLHEAFGGTLLLCPSRRTPHAVISALQQAFPDAFFCPINDTPNPFYGILQLANRIIVTHDSISMISEALAAEKPLSIYRLHGEHPKFSAFLQSLYSQHLAFPFSIEPPASPKGSLESLCVDLAHKLHALLERGENGQNDH